MSINQSFGEHLFLCFMCECVYKNTDLYIFVFMSEYMYYTT